MAQTPQTSLYEAVSNPAIRMAESESRSDLTITSNALSSWVQAGLRFAPDDSNLIRARARCLDSQRAPREFSPRCKHCNRRRIRCLPAPKGPQSRCLNCIRLKKECVPVTEGETVGRDRARHAVSKTTNASQTIPTASGSSPPLGLRTELPILNWRGQFPTNVTEALPNEIARVADPVFPQEIKSENANRHSPSEIKDEAHMPSLDSGVEKSIQEGHLDGQTDGGMSDND